MTVGPSGAEAANGAGTAVTVFGSKSVVVDALPPGYSRRPAGEPDRPVISFTIDGAAVSAPEGLMLVDAAKYGGVEIPVFCYEPKLGQPVGACRMCLVEIEGIPKLQTACSTPVKDGMSVITASPRVREAQNAVVEFLLVNHPLDCPVCDKGGECPLQDISYGWGPGKSRMVEPKRHFEKPIELSPTIAIDRERCILCYRCVRFSQEISEDYQLVLLERGDHAFVGTFDGHPYIAPFSGNIIELCPVGALTSRAYRFRARPWDIEQGGSVCTLCPAQCNVSFTVRDERVMRVLQRDNNGVDDGWLCDKGRFAYQSWDSDERITTPLMREGGSLRPATWQKALGAAATALKKSGQRTAALAGGATTNEEAWLLSRMLREALGSPHLDSRRSGVVSGEVARVLARPALTASVPDIEWADAVLLLDTEPVDDAPILDLRLRKGVRRNGTQLAVATSRPSSLDRNATAVARFAPAAGAAFVQALTAALTGDAAAIVQLAARAGTTAEAVGAVAKTLGDAKRVVILWGERFAYGDRGDGALKSLCNLAAKLGLEAVDGAGMIEIPADTNGRGLREVGFAPNLGPGLSDAAAVGRSTREIAAGLSAGDLSALVLMNADPIGEFGGGPAWGEALAKAGTVVSFSNWLDQTTAEHADIVFPAESNAEKEGTVTHPDGRVQRLRQTVSRNGEVRAVWQVLAELSTQLGLDANVMTNAMVTGQLADAVAFYAGISADELGGAGVRWQERPAASELPATATSTFEVDIPEPVAQPNGKVVLGSYKPLWSGGDVAHAQTIGFLNSGQRIELSPVDGERLGVKTGDLVTVQTETGSERATVALRDSMPQGAAFVLEGSDRGGAMLTGAEPQLAEVVK